MIIMQWAYIIVVVLKTKNNKYWYHYMILTAAILLVIALLNQAIKFDYLAFESSIKVLTKQKVFIIINSFTGYVILRKILRQDCCTKPINVTARKIRTNKAIIESPKISSLVIVTGLLTMLTVLDDRLTLFNMPLKTIALTSIALTALSLVYDKYCNNEKSIFMVAYDYMKTLINKGYDRIS